MAAYCGPPPPSGTVQLMNSCIGWHAECNTFRHLQMTPATPNIPSSILRRLDGTAFAVDAVLRIDLQFHASFSLLIGNIPDLHTSARHECIARSRIYIPKNHWVIASASKTLVDLCRAKTTFRTVIHWKGDFKRHTPRKCNGQGPLACKKNIHL